MLFIIFVDKFAILGKKSNNLKVYSQFKTQYTKWARVCGHLSWVINDYNKNKDKDTEHPRFYLSQGFRPSGDILQPECCIGLYCNILTDVSVRVHYN